MCGAPPSLLKREEEEGGDRGVSGTGVTSIKIIVSFSYYLSRGAESLSFDRRLLLIARARVRSSIIRGRESGDKLTFNILDRLLVL